MKRPKKPRTSTPEPRAGLTKIAAECHRAKWQFGDNEEHLMPAAEARRLVRKAFDELHRIGDLAMKARDEAKTTPEPRGPVRPKIIKSPARRYGNRKMS